MICFIANKKVVAEFVAGILLNSDKDLQSITITRPDIYEDCFALTVTGMSSDVIVEILEQVYFSKLMSTS